MNETEQDEIARLRKRTAGNSARAASSRGGQNVSKTDRFKLTQRGGRTVVLRYGIEYMRELARRGGLARQAQIREASSGKESKG